MRPDNFYVLKQAEDALNEYSQMEKEVAKEFPLASQYMVDVANTLQMARDKAAGQGKNPETVLPLNDYSAFDVQPLLDILEYNNPEQLSKEIDDLIFSYLSALADKEEAAGCFASKYNGIHVLKLLRDAFKSGVIRIK